MAAPEAAATVPYPLPPPFYKLYGSDNPTPPPPPVEPTDEELIVFGQKLDLNEALVPPLQVPQLYAARSDGTIDVKGELLRLNKELKFLFVELLRTLAQCPGEYARQITLINHVLNNMQHLVNTLRPHQARRTLECLLKLQIEQHKESLSRVRAAVESTDATLQAAAASLVQAENDAHASVPVPMSQ